MIKTFGRMPTTKPEGMFVAVRYPVLAVMDQTTGDGRHLVSAGGDARPTPTSTWSISAQFTKDMGHFGAELSGVLHEISFDDETGIVSGAGFLADDEIGRRHAFAIKSGMMAGNSVGLAEVSARFVEDLDTGEYWVEFTKWSVADTSGVMTPAFFEAYATIDEEITASMDTWDLDEELVASATNWTVHVPEPSDEVAELLASATATDTKVQAYSDFFRPEADKPTKIVVTADGKVYGHICTWGAIHASMAGNIRPPRPVDEYRSFNKPGVLTERGIVPTGPIFAYGGHKRGADLDQAYGGIENAWCDGRVIEGIHGPWFSGVVRPGVSEETIYAARASRISGHWVRGDLKAIVSCNAEAFDVAGPDADVLDLNTRLAYRMEGDQVVEMVASFDPDPVSTTVTQAPAAGSAGGGDGSNAVVNVVFNGLTGKLDLTPYINSLQLNVGRSVVAVDLDADLPAAAAAAPSVEALLLQLLDED